MTAAPFSVVSPQQVQQLLTERPTTAQVAKLTGWPQDRVTAVARKIPGWLLDVETDTVYRPSDVEAAEADAAAAADVRERPHRNVPPLLHRAENLADFDKDIGKAYAQTRTALDRLKAAIADYDNRAQREAARKRALDKVAELERQLAEAKEQAKQLGGARRATRKTQTSAGGPSPAQIRVWAASAGVDCPKHGVVPKEVRAAYEEAHR